MVFQRVTSKMMVEAIPIMRKNGVAVVIDIDDDMNAIDQRNPAWAVLHPKSTGHNAEYDWHAATRACAAATVVTVSTDALIGRYAPPGRGVVLHNAVPQIFLDETKFPRVDSEVFGWAGALFSHPDDPQVTGTSMGRLQRAGYTFKIVGAPRGTREAFKLDHDAVTTGPVPVEKWPVEVHKLGITQELLRNAALRDELSQSGRDAVRELTVEKQAWRWWEAWTMAYQIERGPLGVKPAVGSIPA
jgi:hypothetical protein